MRLTAERMDLISAARYEIGEQNPFWPQPVLRALEARQPDAPFDWVEQSLRLWLPASGSPHSRELLDDLELLPARVREDIGGSLLLEKALLVPARPRPGEDRCLQALRCQGLPAAGPASAGPVRVERAAQPDTLARPRGTCAACGHLLLGSRRS